MQSLFLDEQLPAPPTKNALNGRTLKVTTKTSKAAAEKIRVAKEKLLKNGWPKNFVICKDAKDLGRIAREISLTGEFAFDCETSNLNPWTGDLYCSSIYVNGTSYLINFMHPLLPQISVDAYRKNLGQYFSDDRYKRYGFNLNFDMHFHEEQAKIPCGKQGFDSELASWLIRPDLKKGARKLKPLCLMFLGVDHPTYEQLFGSLAWISADPQLAAYYACCDAEFHMQLGKVFESELAKVPALEKLYFKLELPTQNADYEEEREGFLVDENYLLNTVAPKLQATIESLEEELKELVPAHVSVDSPTQLARWLFDELRLPRILGDSVDKTVLEELQEYHPAIPKILELRPAKKLKATFVDGIAILVQNGKVHPSIRTTGSETGRSACDSPNLYNIPVKIGPLIRQAFVASQNEIIVSIDLQGQELRIMAHLCGPGRLREVALAGDLYSEAAATFWGGDSKDYTKTGPNKKKRDIAKVAILALNYGAQEAKMASVFDCSRQRAKQFLNDYYARFPELKRFQEYCASFAKANGYVQTLLGRRRLLDYASLQELFPNDPKKRMLREWALDRFAGNSPVQGTAADQMKLAFILCREYLKSHGYKTRPRFRIHDEIIFYWDKEEWKNPQILADIRQIIATCIPMSIPFDTTVEVYGNRWGMKDEE